MKTYSIKNGGVTFQFNEVSRKWSYFTGKDIGVKEIDISMEVNDKPLSCVGSKFTVVETSAMQDVHGHYTQLSIKSEIQASLQGEILFRVYHDKDFLTVAVSLSNEGVSLVKLGKCHLLSCHSDSHVNLGNSAAIKVLCESAWVIDNAVKMLDSETGEHISKTVGLLYNSDIPAALNCSFVTFDTSETVIGYRCKEGKLSLEAFSNFDGYELLPGKQARSEAAYFQISEDPFASLENWASRVNEHYQPKFAPRPPVGWVGGWNWRDGFTQETYEEIVLENIEAIKRKLGGFGIENIFVSIANYKDMVPGLWNQENLEAFPHGLEWLVKKLGAEGMKLGFWIAPFWIPDRLCNLAEEHKDHLLKAGGKYIGNDYKFPYGKSGTLPEEERVSFYHLDGSHPKSLEFLKKTFETNRKLGIRYYMTDFLHAGSGSTPGHFVYDEYHDRSKIKGPEVYREALKVIREAAGPDTYLLSSTGTTFQNVGCVDGVRIGRDIGEGRPLIDTYATYPGTYTTHHWDLIRSVVTSTACAYFTDRKLYYNDAFNALTIDKPVPLEEARATVSMFGLTSGPVMLADDIATMSDERLVLIKKCLPQYDRTAKPVDLFTAIYPDTPKIFNLRVEKEWDAWNVIGIVNADKTPLKVDLDLSKLGLKKGDPHVAFDFWNESYLGEVPDIMPVEVPSQTVKVLKICKARTHPWLLSTDMHITQGGVEVSHVEWNAKKKYLKGVCHRPAGESGNLYLRLPIGWKPTKYDGLNVVKVFTDKTVIAMLRLKFETETLTWRVDMEEVRKVGDRNYEEVAG